MSSYADSLVPSIRAILGAADFSTISAKGVRRQLVALGEDEATVKANRSAIDEHISAIYEELTSGATHAAAGSDDDERGEAPSSMPLSRHDHVAGGSSSMARARLATSAGKADPAAPAKKRKVVVKRKKADTDGHDGDADGEPKKKRGSAAFNKELILSPQLSAFLGEDKLSRPQTVKRMWEYIREHDLQNPTDKREIICDAQLQSVFGVHKVTMFSMNKYLSQHFTDPDKA